MDFKVIFSESNEKVLPIVFSESDHPMDADFGEIQVVNLATLPEYEGDYAVTPKVVEQTMPTKGKAMVEDVTVRAIPFFDVSNNSGGSTVFIAKEM